LARVSPRLQRLIGLSCATQRKPFRLMITQLVKAASRLTEGDSSFLPAEVVSECLAVGYEPFRLRQRVIH
jgi:hypothetical protein